MRQENDWSRAFNITSFNANTLTTTRNESWHAKIKHFLSSFTELNDLVKTLLEIDGQNPYCAEKALKVSSFYYNRR